MKLKITCNKIDSSYFFISRYTQSIGIMASIQIDNTYKELHALCLEGNIENILSFYKANTDAINPRRVVYSPIIKINQHHYSSDIKILLYKIELAAIFINNCDDGYEDIIIYQLEHIRSIGIDFKYIYDVAIFKSISRLHLRIATHLINMAVHLGLPLDTLDFTQSFTDAILIVEFPEEIVTLIELIDRCNVNHFAIDVVGRYAEDAFTIALLLNTTCHNLPEILYDFAIRRGTPYSVQDSQFMRLCNYATEICMIEERITEYNILCQRINWLTRIESSRFSAQFNDRNQIERWNIVNPIMILINDGKYLAAATELGMQLSQCMVEDYSCCVCLQAPSEEVANSCITSCTHMICLDCLIQLKNSNDSLLIQAELKCPLCRQNINFHEIKYLH